MTTAKYKLVRPLFNGSVDEGPWGKGAHKVYRIKALRDIPEINVKSGDLGGLVTSEMNLAQFGNCWITYDAKVFGHVFIVDNAYISDNAVVTCDMERESMIIRGETLVAGNATITLEPNEDGSPVTDSIITGMVTITDNAMVRNVGTIRGTVSIFDSVALDGVAEIVGEAYLTDRVRVNKGSKIQGSNSLHGDTLISDNCTIIDSTLQGSVTIFQGQTVKDVLTDEEGNVSVRSDTEEWIPEDSIDDTDDIWDAFSEDDLEEEHPVWDGDSDWEESEEEFTDKHGNTSYDKGFRRSITKGNRIALTRETAVSAEEAEKKALIDDAILLLAEINTKSGEYESDIVKIIKYPVMADKSCPSTAELHVALGRANRMSLNPAHTGFVDAVTNAEKAFLAAESYALKMASTVFTDAEKKKVSKVNNLLSIASNEASSENEKEQAFRQAFKHLEGVIAVPEVAVDAFRIKIGLKEIEG